MAKKAGRLARAETDRKWFRRAWDVKKWRERGTILLLKKVGCYEEEIDRVLAGGDLGSKEACKA